MKIGLIASIWISVPPKGFGFGAQEYLAWCIAEGLMKKGHDVTLFATADSKTTAKLVSIADQQIEDLTFPDSRIKDVFEMMNLSEAYKHAHDFDIFHNHLLPYGPLFSHFSPTPTVHTLHHRIDKESADIFLYRRYKDQQYVSISNTQRNIVPELHYVDTVYNGVDTNFYTYQEKPKDNYLLYIGRMKKYKGIHSAIAVAKKLGLKLKIASPLPTATQSDYNDVMHYWEHDIKPALNADIEHIGILEGDEKVRLLQDAKVLLVPIEWEEPFGMTMIEAMSCGTPVIAFANGAAPELIVDAKTGYVVNQFATQSQHSTITTTGLDGLIAATEKIYALSESEYSDMRTASRTHVEHAFSVEKMVDGYEAVYKKVLENPRKK